MLKKGDFKSTLDYNHEGLEIALKFNDIENLASFYLEFGNLYLLIEKYDFAKEYLLKSNDLCIKTNNKIALAMVHGSLGEIAIKENLLNEAEDNYQESLKLCTITGDTPGISDCFLKLGQLEMIRKDTTKALVYFNKGLDSLLHISY